MAGGPRRCTAEEAAALLEPADTLGIPLGPGQPPAFLHALGEREVHAPHPLVPRAGVDGERQVARTQTWMAAPRTIAHRSAPEFALEGELLLLGFETAGVDAA